MNTRKCDADEFLDITGDVCPLTFVKTRLRLERLSSGRTLLVRLGAGEPLANVPRSVAELGHEIISLEPDESTADTHYLLIRKH